MWKTYNIDSNEVRYVGLSFSILRKYYGWFAELYPEEVWQITLLAALEAEPFDATREAANAIQRIIRHQLKAYGWRLDPMTRKWINPERTRFIDGYAYKSRSEYLWARGDRCGVGGCSRMGVYHDGLYVFLCTTHYGYVQRRKRDGVMDAYEGIERLRHGRVPHAKVQCATCGTTLLRERKEVKRYSRFFCGQSCAGKDPHRQRNKVRGTRHHNAKLNEMQVREIRHLLALGKSQCAIAKSFNVGCDAIRSIRDGKTWAHVAAA